MSGGTILVALIGAVATVAVGLLAWRTGKTNAANTFTANVLQRLDSVEDQLDEVRDQLAAEQGVRQAAVRFIDRLFEWGSRGGKGVPPKPSEELHKYLDPTLWQQEQKPPQP